MKTFRFALVTLALTGAGAVAAIACGGSTTDGESGDAGNGTDGSSAQDSGSPTKDSGSAIVDAGPDAVCPAQWEVYGNTDPSSDLGHVDPRLIASGECHGPVEQFADGGFLPSDFAFTMTQSAPGSGMFVTEISQTTPFPIHRTTCLLSSGPNTGAAGYPDDGGLMCLTDVPEDAIPWNPNLVTFTNLENADGGVFINLNQSSDGGSVGIGNAWCRFVKN